jgi:hypothetical protein
MALRPGSFRAGVENRTEASGEGIEDYAATGGAFRVVMSDLTPEMSPGDLGRAAEAIHQAVDTEELAQLSGAGQRRPAAHRRQVDQFRASSRRGGTWHSSRDVRCVRVRVRFRVRR